MGKAYYIDGENVGRTWMKLGIEFSQDDEIYVFGNHKSQLASKEYIENSTPSVKNMLVDTKGHNDLDILLAGCIGASIGQGKDFVIISNDTGYKTFIEFFSKHYDCSIERIKIPDTFSSIGKAQKKINKLDIENVKKDFIISLLEKHRYDKKAKEKLYKALCKAYGRTEGKELYSMVKKYVIR